MNEYYTYAYLREDGTPYYIGKGKGGRINYAYGHRINLPPKERRIFLKKNLTEEEALNHEEYIISVLGRKDLGTGILQNLSSGGLSNSGWNHSDDAKRRIGDAQRNPSEDTRRRKGIASSQKTMSDTAKQSIAEYARNRPAHVLKKMSESHKGVKFSEERKQKMREAQQRRRERERLHGN